MLLRLACWWAGITFLGWILLMAALLVSPPREDASAPTPVPVATCAVRTFCRA